MKRIISLVLLVCLLLTMAACGSAAPEATPEPAPELTPEPTPDPPAEPEEYFEPIPEGHNQITFYYRSPEGYENCDMWIWFPGADGKGHLFTECEYGAKVIVNVPEGIEEVGFIVRRNCSDPGGSSWGSATKDFESDRFAKIEGRENFVYLLTGDGNQYISKDGGKTLDMAKKFKMASMADRNVISYSITPKTNVSDPSMLKVYEGDREIEIAELTSFGKESDRGEIILAEDLDLSGNYRVVLEGYGEKAVIPMEIFDSEYFADNFHYDGDDLGAVIKGGETVFKLWAPTASKVVLRLYEEGEGVEAYKSVELVKGDKGVWSHTESCGHGTYYDYEVTTAVGTQETMDPYAKAAGVNGNRGMVVDLGFTDPEGWDSAELKNPISAYSEAIIWEVHVRDFSNKIEDSQYKGKYLAFTETGLKNEAGESVGIDYLRELGITHVHLLPVYDYATVDESSPEDEFNWGYDPKNYNVPEGSYSTDPYNGEVRINEYKQMVQALHEAGIAVIMDMVYNHTYDGNSSFNRVVPYYYYRYDSTGANTSASGCGNDTASERYMFRKFMVDSTSYWVEEYKLDGLRFDLMGLHDVETMQQVEAAVHSINPSAIIYGEGWTMGATIDGSAQANQSNISKIVPTGNAVGAVAVFSDVIRDGLKGSVFDKAGQGYINGLPAANKGKIIFSLKGGQGVGQGWSVNDSMVINYMSAHDNNTLWDKLLLSNGDQSDEERVRINRFGAAIVMLAKGTPFWQAGEEMLRTKGGDENSYKSSDEVNNIDWSVLIPGSMEHDTMLYYKGLIAMRKGLSIFTEPNVTVEAEELTSGVMVAKYSDGRGGEAIVLLNPQKTALPYTLEGEWNLVADASAAGAEAMARESGSVSVEAVAVRVYVNDALLG